MGAPGGEAYPAADPGRGGARAGRVSYSLAPREQQGGTPTTKEAR
jgi:hypothetical protein